MAVMIDTLKVTRRLRDAGASEQIAEALADVVAESTSISREDLATKADLKVSFDQLDHKIDGSVEKLRTEIAQAQNRTLIWMFGMLVGFSTIIVSAIKLL